MIRNILAVIGAVTVAVHAVRGYNKYLREPISDMLTEAADAEYERRQRTRSTTRPEPPTQ